MKPAATRILAVERRVRPGEQQPTLVAQPRESRQVVGPGREPPLQGILGVFGDDRVIQHAFAPLRVCQPAPAGGSSPSLTYGMIRATVSAVTSSVKPMEL